MSEGSGIPQAGKPVPPTPAPALKLPVPTLKEVKIILLPVSAFFQKSIIMNRFILIKIH
jgi:hypothetical protein